MPTNANTFNSRVTSEALEKKFRDTFPAQGGAELIQDLFAQGVIVPVVDFTDAAKGSELSQNLQTAWDFSTGYSTFTGTNGTIISNPGFWQIGLTVAFEAAAGTERAVIDMFDGVTAKEIWSFKENVSVSANVASAIPGQFVAFARSGDSILAGTTGSNITLEVWYRQIADVNGNLVNPLGFVSS